MTSIRKVFLQVKTPILMPIRFRGKINIQKPRPPHYDKQLLLDLTRPILKPYRDSIPEITLCNKHIKKYATEEIDNPFERILAKECLNWFNTSKMVIFIHTNAISMEDKNPLFANLKRNNMDLRKYGKKIVSMATTGTRYEVVNKLFSSHQDIIFGQPESLGKLFKILKKSPQMIIMAGIIQDRLMSKNELLEFSQLPSLDAARSQLCAVLDSAGSCLAGQLQHSQQTLVGHLGKHVELQNSAICENSAPET